MLRSARWDTQLLASVPVVAAGRHAKRDAVSYRKRLRSRNRESQMPSICSAPGRSILKSSPAQKLSEQRVRVVAIYRAEAWSRRRGSVHL